MSTSHMKNMTVIINYWEPVVCFKPNFFNYYYNIFQTLHNNMILEMDHTTAGTVRVPGKISFIYR